MSLVYQGISGLPSRKTLWRGYGLRTHDCSCSVMVQGSRAAKQAPAPTIEIRRETKQTIPSTSIYHLVAVLDSLGMMEKKHWSGKAWFLYRLMPKRLKLPLWNQPVQSTLKHTVWLGVIFQPLIHGNEARWNSACLLKQTEASIFILGSCLSLY